MIAPTRRPLPAHPKLANPILDGAAWPAFPPLDEAYGCLGTTRKKAGSDAAFRAVDLDLALGFARAAKAAGASRFGLVSSVGADARSGLLYPRTKGEVEAAVAALGFGGTVVVRPSFLLGERTERRPAERLAIAVFQAFGPFMIGPLRRWRAVPAEEVAAAMIAALRGRANGTFVLESESL